MDMFKILRERILSFDYKLPFIIIFVIICIYLYLLLLQSSPTLTYISNYVCNHIRGLQTQPISTSATLPPASAWILHRDVEPWIPEFSTRTHLKVQDDQDKLHPHLLNHHRRLTILTIPNQTAFPSPPLPFPLPTHTHTFTLTTFMWGQLIHYIFRLQGPLHLYVQHRSSGPARIQTFGDIG